MLRLLAFIFIFYSTFSYSEFVGTNLQYARPNYQFKFATEDKTITMEANPLAELSLLFLGPSYAFGLQFSGELSEDKEFLESNYSDFIISYYTPSFIVDLFYRSFEDFYVQSDLEEITEANKEVIAGSDIGAQILFMDEKNLFEFHGDYVFSPKTQYDYFIKLRLSHAEIAGENKIIPSKYATDFSNFGQVEKITSDNFETQLGISGLYAFDFIFINSYLSFGPRFESYLIEGEENTDLNLISPVGEGFLGVSYYQDNLQIGLRAVNRTSMASIQGVELTQSYSSQYIYLLFFF